MLIVCVGLSDTPMTRRSSADCGSRAGGSATSCQAAIAASHIGSGAWFDAGAHDSVAGGAGTGFSNASRAATASILSHEVGIIGTFQLLVIHTHCRGRYHTQ